MLLKQNFLQFHFKQRLQLRMDLGDVEFYSINRSLIHSITVVHFNTLTSVLYTCFDISFLHFLCFRDQLALYNIFLSVDIANGFQCNRFLLSSLIANMVTILINFQQILLRTFQHFAIKFLSQEIFLAHLKSASKSL